jgi:hypothetical protein
MPTNYTGNPTATQPPAAAPAPGVLPILVLPADGDPANAASVAQAYKVLADYVANIQRQALGTMFGDGSDGTVLLDGSFAAPPGMSKAGSIYSLTRDFYASSVSVLGAATQLKFNGFRLFVRNNLTTSGGASVNADGVAASTTTGGTGQAAGTVNGSSTQAGRDSPPSAGIAGQNATNITAAFGGAGGNGGAVTVPGAFAGGLGGTVTAPPGAGSLRNLSLPHLGYFVSHAAGVVSHTPFIGGAGGGSGATGVAGFTGGGGGGGGGIAVCFARVIQLASGADLRAGGGAAGAGQSGGTQGGGGGGGGGGVLLVSYGSSNVTFSAATNTAGGAGGAGFGGAANGQVGSNGLVLTFA